MSARLDGPVRFGVFELDPNAGELRKAGVRINLPDQPFQVLKALLDRPGELVTREELRQRLWPAETFVDFDQGLNAAVRRLRDALGIRRVAAICGDAASPRLQIHRSCGRPAVGDNQPRSARSNEGQREDSRRRTKRARRARPRRFGVRRSSPRHSRVSRVPPGSRIIYRGLDGFSDAASRPIHVGGAPVREPDRQS